MKKNILKEYTKLNPPSSEFVFAEEFLPKPNESDYIDGGIERFFVKKINENSIIEVSRQNYKATTPMLYEKVELWWNISGYLHEVVEKNKKTLKASKLIMPGLEGKLINPSQFFKR
jgi:spermidine/putrescine-binding protein